jgi:electron transfer flavoprotein alpha subunit
MIAVYLEVRDGKIKKSSLEALSEAKRRSGELGVEAAAVLIGSAVAGLAPGAHALGASKVYVIENNVFADYSSQAYAIALAGFAAEAKPSALFFAATAMGKDLAPRAAARLGAALASDCTKIAVKDGALEFTRPIYAGKAFLSFRLKSSPQLATLRPNVFPLGQTAGGAGETIRLDAAVPEDVIKGRVTAVLKEESAELDVTEAEVVVSGGRGLKGAEAFSLLRDLAAVFPRAAVGASRSAVDSGWIGHQHQVGQTGKTVSPNLYLAVGISGAIQHLAGMSSSKVIVAINKDPEAPIFKIADYGIVGDLFEVVPKLKDELKKALAE